MNTLRWFVLTAIIIFIFLGLYLACSSTPDVITGQELAENAVVQPVDASERNNPGLWGYYSVAVYPEERRVEITPNRTAWMSLNVIPFMHGPGGEMAALQIEILEYEDLGVTGDCKVGVKITHPFPGLPEFSGFDVMGLFMGRGSGHVIDDPSLVFPVLGVDPVLMNADGMTRWFNPTEFPGDAPWGFYDPLSDENSGFIANSTMSAYKYFAEGLGAEQELPEFFADPVNCAQRGLFSSGASCTRNYEIRFPLVGGNPEILFNYAIMAEWEEPVPSPPNHIPEDFPESANAQFPIFASITDYSTLYYVDESNFGGDLLFDIELYDWSNLWSVGAIRDEITRVYVESTDNILENNHWEASLDDLLFTHGDSMISAHLILTISGSPSATGTKEFTVAVEVGSGYDQGYGATVPNAPLALYLRPRVPIVECPRCVITGMSKSKFATNTLGDDVDLFGSGFISGPDLSIKLLNEMTGQEIQGMGTHIVDGYTLRTDFDFDGIIPASFNVVAVNGCGAKAIIPAGLPLWDGLVRVVDETPHGVTATTSRTGPWAEIVDSLKLSWSATLYAEHYRIMVDYDPWSAPAPEGFSDELQVLGITSSPTYTHDSASLIPFNNHSSCVYIIRSITDLDPGGGESLNSNPVFYSGQDFDSGVLERWGFRGQNGNPILDYIGDEGFTGEGFSFSAPLTYLPSAQWLIIYTPEIPYIASAEHAFFEFDHRHTNFQDANGYFVGYTTTGLPQVYYATVPGVVRINNAAYGGGYNDANSPAIQAEFQYASPSIYNYRKDGSGWWGWYFSGFNVSDALLHDESRIIIGIAVSEAGSTHGFGLDDCSLIVY